MPDTFNSMPGPSLISGLSSYPTTLSSKEMQAASWSERLKAASLFSARTSAKSYLDFLKQKLVAVSSRSEIPQVAEKGLQQALSAIGYTPQTGFPGDREKGVPSAVPGSTADLSSSRRIQLIIDTNVKQARSLGQIATSENPVFLMANPAWHLTRTGARKKPRGDWKRRWKAAGDACGWKGALKNEMMALKTSPIWGMLARGMGGYKDVVGSPYPPFAFGSGLAWVNVRRSQWRQKCAAEGVPDGLEEIRDKARELKYAKTPEPQPTTPFKFNPPSVIPAPSAPAPSIPSTPERTKDDELRESYRKAVSDAKGKVNSALREVADRIQPSVMTLHSDSKHKMDELVADGIDIAPFRVLLGNIEKHLNEVVEIRHRLERRYGELQMAERRTDGLNAAKMRIVEMTAKAAQIDLDAAEREFTNALDARRVFDNAVREAIKEKQTFAVQYADAKRSLEKVYKIHPEVDSSEDVKNIRIELADAKTDEERRGAMKNLVAAIDKVWKPATSLERNDFNMAQRVSPGIRHTVAALPIEGTNPNYSSARGRDERKKWRQNCQRCVPAYEMRRRGYDVTAKPRPLDDAEEKRNGLAFNNRWSDAYKNAVPVHWKNKADCERIMASWGDGARAEVCIKWKGENGNGHVFAAEQIDGHTVFYDPQNPSANAGGYFGMAYTDRSRYGAYNKILRVDNLEFSDKILLCADKATRSLES